MINYADFLARFGPFSVRHSIRWAVIGSHAMVVHAGRAGIAPRRAAHDLDLIAFMPRAHDEAFRAWLDRRSQWVYEKKELGAIHLWCEDGQQVDIFTKPTTHELEDVVLGEVLGVNCPIVSVRNARSALHRWATDTAHKKHPRHFDHTKYREDFDWFTANFQP